MSTTRIRARRGKKRISSSRTRTSIIIITRERRHRHRATNRKHRKNSLLLLQLNKSKTWTQCLKNMLKFLELHLCSTCDTLIHHLEEGELLQMKMTWVTVRINISLMTMKNMSICWQSSTTDPQDTSSTLPSTKDLDSSSWNTYHTDASSKWARKLLLWTKGHNKVQKFNPLL